MTIPRRWRHGRPGEPADRRVSDDEFALRRLLAEVFRTRAATHEQQAKHGATTLTLLPAREATLEALENYAVALGRRGWPFPPKMRSEIHLLRSLCETTELPRGYDAPTLRTPGHRA